MTKAKQTLDQYNQTREEGRKNLQPLFDEKNNKREALKINLQGATDQEKKIARELYKSQSTRLSKSRKVLNADLIAKYQELYQQKKLDQATFQRGLEEFRKLDPEVDEQALKDLLMGKSKKNSIETTSNLPSAVAIQESKAIAYFNQNNEAKCLQVIEQIKRLRTEGKINYTDLGNGRYSVIMPCGNKKVKMKFPADTSLSDTSDYYIDRDDNEISKKETTRGKLWSKEGKKYFEQKEKQGKGLLSKSDFQTLIASLLPDGIQEEQILAFMIATGFYGWMWLSNKTGDYQLSVGCCRDSDDRKFYDMCNSDIRCSLVHSTFIE